MTTERYESIALNLIDEDVDNHRLLHDKADDDKLRESIEREGLQQPIKVCTKPDGRYTLVFGFRRKKAVAALGYETIAAAVVEGLAPSEIRKLQALENLDRRELHPLEEAQFCQDLAEQFDPLRSSEKTEAAFVAAAIGRPLRWVEGRLALARLSPRVQQGFLDGEIAYGHAKEIAKLVGHTDQEEVFGQVKAQPASHFLWDLEHLDNVDIFDEDGDLDREKLAKAPESIRQQVREATSPPSTITETRNLVEQRLRQLSNVSWRLDVPFDGKVACDECPSNSTNQPTLFDKHDEPEAATCLDQACFEEKRKCTMRAIRRACNTAVKEGMKATPEGVEPALVQREVTYVKADDVATAVKYAKKPGDAKKKTASERKGEASAAQEREVMDAYRDRLTAWADDVQARLKTSADDTAYGRMVLTLYGILLDLRDSYRKPKGLEAALKKAKPLVATRSQKNVLELCKIVQPYIDDDMVFEGRFYNDGIGRLEALVEAFGLDAAKPPTEEEIKRELFPPADAGSAKPPAKKRAKRKAAAKPKKKTTKKKARKKR